MNRASAWGPTLVLLAVAMVTCVLYWPGLQGPLLFDDYANLAPVDDWLQGRKDFAVTLLPNPDSVLFSRPLAMASFMLTGCLWEGTFGLKLGNLLLHLACGLAAWRALRSIMSSCPDLSVSAAWAGALAACIWLLHPLQVSTVLYGVQRMAQISTLFVLLAVWCYVAARHRLASGDVVRGCLMLFLAVPALTVMGLLGKQNAAVVPLVCLGIEIACFRGRRPLAVSGFFALSVLLPVVGVLAILLVAPERLLGGYSELEFTAAQKLWTQPRALLDYMIQWFVPNTPAMGLYTDAYPVSSGPMAPPATLLSIVALSLVTVAGFLLRRASPSILAGWLFFLASHAVEASFLPIEMYYEHRNYLPAVGLMLFATGVVFAIARRTPRVSVNKRLSGAGFAVVCLTLSFATLGRVGVWQDELAMTEQGMRRHPDSLRVHQDRLSLMLRRGDEPGARAVISHLAAHALPRQKLIGAMDAVVVDCAFDHSVDAVTLTAAQTWIQPRLTVYEVHGAHLLETATRFPSCQTPEIPLAAAHLVSRIVDGASEQDMQTANKSMMRRLAGQLYARAGRWDLARPQAQLAWEGERNLPNASLLVRAEIHAGSSAAAEAALEEMRALRDAEQPSWREEINGLSDMVMRKNRQDVLD